MHRKSPPQYCRTQTKMPPRSDIILWERQKSGVIASQKGKSGCASSPSSPRHTWRRRKALGWGVARVTHSIRDVTPFLPLPLFLRSFDQMSRGGGGGDGDDRREEGKGPFSPFLPPRCSHNSFLLPMYSII